MIVNENYWNNFTVTDDDLEAIYNFLLETESPLDKFDLTRFLIDRTIQNLENSLLKEEKSRGESYLPEKEYKPGDILRFPARNYATGKVTSVRSGNNPDFPELQVIDVEMATGESTLFAANLRDHKLNHPTPVVKQKYLDRDQVYEEFSSIISERLVERCATSKDLVCIAKHYFPRALLFDIGIGHLNLCEAVLEMASGGPMTTMDLIAQIELPTGNNERLTEFSLNFALEQDGRFDEVGPAGVTLWFLKRLEPVEVQKPPHTLLFTATLPENREDLIGFVELNRLVDDELESTEEVEKRDETTITLSYPHWRAGTMPLTEKNRSIFPTAYETPRVKFLFIDGNTHESFSGWVVRPNRYVYGLREWYLQQGIIPGSIITIKRSRNPEEVIVQTSKSKSSRDWIKTVLVGTDGGIVFALLKQVITCTYDERMAIMVPDVESVDAIWTNTARSKQPLEKTVLSVMREMVKLNLQNQIHAQELYSSVNVIRRVSPSQVLATLYSQPWAKHLGDLYFKLEESA